MNLNLLENKDIKDYLTRWYTEHPESSPGRAISWAWHSMPKRRWDGEQLTNVNEREKFSYLRKNWDKYVLFCKENNITIDVYESLTYGNEEKEERTTW